MSVVILSPHIDDEVLGCFAFLAPRTHVVFGGVEARPTIPRKTRLAELEASAAALGFTWELLDNTVNGYRSADLVGPFEQVIGAHRPDTVLLPEPSYNRDHREMHDAALIATRPHDVNHRVEAVLLFEQPHVLLWPHHPPHEPSLFVEIDVEAKLAAYARYASQVRGHRSPETVRALATLRGAAIGRPAAEGFRTKRLVWPRGGRNWTGGRTP